MAITKRMPGSDATRSLPIALNGTAREIVALSQPSRAIAQTVLTEQNDWLARVNPNDRETLLDYLVKIQSP
jgi:hypothetical protein